MSKIKGKPRKAHRLGQRRTHAPANFKGSIFLGSSFLKVKAVTTEHCATVVNAQSRHLQWRQKPGSGINYLPVLCSFKPSGQAQPSPQVRRDTLGSPKEPQQPPPPPTYLARYAPVSRVLWAPHDPCHSPAAGATWTRRQPRKVGASAARRRGSAGIAMSKGWWRVVVRLRWRRGGCAAEAIGGSG